MSRYESESGTFKLPPSEFPKFRKKIEQADRARKERLFNAAQELWKSIPPADRKSSYRFTKAMEDRLWPMAGPDGSDPRLPGGITNAEAERLFHLMQPEYLGEPKRPTKTSMGLPTSRTTRFSTGDGSGIIFDREHNTVHWTVPENNRAVQRARETPVAKAFFQALDEVRWTPGTGGNIYGNDEYSRDEDGFPGAGGDYCTGAYGPRGAAENPSMCRPYTDSKGRRYSQRDIAEASKREIRRQEQARKRAFEANNAPQGRVPRGVPSGGQFAAKHHPEGDIGL